jgi:hypothetical protein
VVPYATDAANGVLGAARLSASLGGRTVSGAIPERAVLAGEPVTLR